MSLSTLLAAVSLLGSMAIANPPQEAGKSLAERLGYKATDRLLLIHADDVGMCHSVNVATINAMEKGVVTCASIMIPCPWMPEIADYCKTHPEADFGLHLTLTSEWRFYRWRTVAPYNTVPGLIDKEGFIHGSETDTNKYASAKEVETEVRAQIARAREFGIKPTHVDSHMGTLFFGKFYPVYTRVAKESGYMPMILYPTSDRIVQAKEFFGVDAMAAYKEMQKQKFVSLDYLKEGASGDTLETRRAHYYQAFRDLKPGVTEFIVHLAMDDEEIKHIANSWRQRYF
ncbi:MAG: polysaccharide deacetylase family protein, partial [Chthonomonadales bacterium]